MNYELFTSIFTIDLIMCAVCDCFLHKINISKKNIKVTFASNFLMK